jgi:diguanylate cyclase (GGDEF)-like protein
MLDSIHTPTLGLATAVVQITLAAIMLFFLHTRKTYPGFGNWATSQALWSIGFVLLVLRGIVSDFASIVVGNYLIICGMAFFYDGLGAFKGQRWHWKTNGIVHVLGLVCIAYMAWHAFVVPDVNLRVGAINLFRLLLSILCAATVWRNRRIVGFRKVYRLLTFVFLISMATSTARVYWALTSAPIGQLMTDDLAFRVYMLFDLFFFIAVAFSVLVLTSARIEEELDYALRKADAASRTDALTGVWNRAHFESIGPLEAERARRYGTPLSVLIFDIDHFKRINDRLGHAAGDHVIRQVATQATAMLRSSDLLFRWGGEEFVVLLPVEVHAATEAAEKLRQRIAVFDFGPVQTVTISIGVTRLHPRESMESALQRADAMLYRAKESGRNCVVVDAGEGEGSRAAGKA